MRTLITLLLGNPLGIAVVIAIVVLGALLWFRDEIKELRESEEMKERDQER